MVENIHTHMFIAYCAAIFDNVRRFLWNYAPQPVLSTIFRLVIKTSSSPIVYEPPVYNPATSNYIVCTGVDPAIPCIIPTALPSLYPPYNTPNYTLDGVLSPDPLHYYVFLDMPAWKGEDNKNSQVGTDMVPYKARGMSFCPILAGVTYIESLVKAYTVLMIPTFVDHWFELSAFDSQPPGQINCQWFFQTSLWSAPWFLLRHAIQKTISSLRRLFRWITYKPVHPPIPRIVVIRVDGEAVPVNFAEDCEVTAKANFWFDKGLESLKEHCNKTTSSIPTRTALDIPPLVTGSTTTDHVVVDTNAYCPGDALTRPVGLYSQASFATVEQPDVTIKPPSNSEFSSLISDSEMLDERDASEPSSSDILGDQFKMLHSPVDVPNEQLWGTEEITSIVPLLGCDAPTPSDCEDEMNDVELSSLLDIVTHSAHGFDQEDLGDADGMEEQHSAWENPEESTFSPCSLVSFSELDGFENSSESEVLGAATLSAEPQHTPSIMKGVRFAIPDELDAAEHCEVPWIIPDTETCNRALDSGEEVEGDVCMPLPILDAQDGPRMDWEEVIPMMEMYDPIFPVVLNEIERQEDDLPIFEPLPPSPVNQLVVKLPSSRWMHIKDFATRSPAQELSLTAPVVIGNTPSCVVKTVPDSEARPLTTPRTEELILPPTHAELRSGPIGSPDDKVNACKTMPDIVYCAGESSEPPSSRTDGMTMPPLGSPINDSESSSSEVQPVEILSSAPALLERVPAAHVTCPSQEELPITEKSSMVVERVEGHEAELAVASESPAHPSAKEDVADLPPKDEPPTSNVAPPDTPVVAPHPAAATELHQTIRPKRLSAAPGTYKEFVPRSMKSAVEKIANTDGGTSDALTNPDVWESPGATKNIAPYERLLSGSIHAPSEPAPCETRLPTTSSSSSSTDLTESKSFSRLPTIADNMARRMSADMTRRNTPMSMHAPQLIASPTKGSPRRHLHTPHVEVDGGRHPYIASLPSASSEWKPVPKPNPPDWAAMPDVVAAFRPFKPAPSRNMLQRVPSIVERMNRRPIGTVIDQKGSATNSLDSTPVTASSFMTSVLDFWVHGNGLPLVRGQVPSNPADFDLRTCTNPGTLVGTQRVIVTPAEQVLHPAMMSGIFPHPSQPKMGSVPVNSDFSSNYFMVGSPPAVHHRNSVRRPQNAGTGNSTTGPQSWTSYRDGTR